MRVDGAEREADIFFYADKDEYEADQKRHEAQLAKAKAEHARAVEEYEVLRAGFETRLAAYKESARTFPARKAAAVASLPTLAARAAQGI